jgi:DNA-binding NarL/FixJ family response regulator
MAARACKPDIVLLAARLPDGSALDACQRLRAEHPQLRTIMMSMAADQDVFTQTVRAGASGYVLMCSEPEYIVEAVQNVAHGGSVIDPGVAATALGWARAADEPRAVDKSVLLSEQQRQILPLIALGMTNRQIAERLYLSEHTVKSYVSSLLKKLGFSRRAQAAAFVVQYQPAPQPRELVAGREQQTSSR